MLDLSTTENYVVISS